MPTSAPRSLAEQFRGWPDDRLAALLAARPDLGTPAPHDSAQLALRAGTRTSVVRALDGLDELHLAVLEAVARGRPDAVDAGGVEAAVGRLLDLALLWGSDDEPRPVQTVLEVLGPAGPAEPALEGLPTEARALLDHLDAEDKPGHTTEPLSIPANPSTPLAHLLARGLVTPSGGQQVVLPWTVRLALRGGRSTRSPVALPDLATSTRSQDLVDRAAAGAAYEVVRRVELLLDQWGTSPPVVLKAGGLSVRDLRAAAALLGLDPPEAAWHVEVAHAAGLVEQGVVDDDLAWLPTDAFDAWSARPIAARWTALARGWLESPRAMHLVGHRIEGSTVNALSPDLARHVQVPARLAALGELAGLSAGEVLAAGTGEASLLERLRWRAPRSLGRLPIAAVTLQKAARLGVSALGGMASYARPLLGGEDEAAVTGLESLLPTPVDHILIQADLTAVAPGPLEPALARQVALVADVESRGGATVYRFSATSLRRAFDAGWSTAEIRALLADASRTPVPQALDYLVDDVARRFGTVRIGSAEAFVRSDDEAALAELLHHPSSKSLRLRRIAPTVLVSDVPVQTLLPRLREAGVAPVVEAADGTVRIARPDVHRARSVKRARHSPADDVRRAAHSAAIVRSIRAGDRAASSRSTTVRASSPADVVTLTREVIERGERMLVVVLDATGTQETRIVTPYRIEAGQLLGLDAKTREDRSLPLHRVREAWRI